MNIFRRDKLYKKGQRCNGYEIVKVIGEGRYGIAYLGKNREGSKVVIKQLKKNMLYEVREKIKFEKEILRLLNNEAFPKFITSFEDEGRRGYILEYKEGRTFEEIIYSEEYVFTRKEIYSVCKKLLNIIHILEEKKVVHKDIRVANVIEMEDGELALIDFGLARFINGEKYTEDLDFWYLGDFLLHLYYTSFEPKDGKKRAWYEELELRDNERNFIKRLMGIDEGFKSLLEVEREFEKIVVDEKERVSQLEFEN
ncbi:MAG: protein kinase family protein [Clostridium sp.]